MSRDSAHTSSARGDDQRQAIGQSARWAALHHLVLSAGSIRVRGQPEGGVPGNKVKAAGGEIDVTILLGQRSPL